MKCATEELLRDMQSLDELYCMAVISQAERDDRRQELKRRLRRSLDLIDDPSGADINETEVCT